MSKQDFFTLAVQWQGKYKRLLTQHKQLQKDYRKKCKEAAQWRSKAHGHYDDRNSDSSVKTVSGGLPGLGKNRKN